MSFRPSRADGIVAAVTGGIVLCLLGLTAAVARTDPSLAAEIPAVGSVPWWLGLAAILVQCVALTWVRHAPSSALLGLVAVPLAIAPFELGVMFGVTALPVGVGVYRAVVHGRPFPRWPVLAATFAVLTAACLVESRGEPGGAVVGALAVAQAIVVVGAPVLLALFVAAQHATRSAQRAEIQALAREREALVEAALARERTAMARELHDIAAHHLSGIALMAAALERQIDSQPEVAKVSVRQVREQSTSVLADLRRLVGLMRPQDAAAERDAESIAAIPDLVARHPGEASFEAPGGIDTTGIGPLAQLAAYRTVQESLANALRHAPGAASHVEILPGADSLVVTVRNEAAGRGPTAARGPADVLGGSGGFGLLGMRERADLTGADLRYGPTPDGGWEVALRLPRDTIARETSTGEAP